MERRPRTRRILLADAPAAPAGPHSTALLVGRFLDSIRHERALAENTQAAYRRDLVHFADWLGGRRLDRLDVRDLGDYLGTLAGRGLARASIARQVATLRTFFAFL